jgi:CO/xanthine dehydrogenase Mo-binding subunit/aerobic-type carbon monoxide dehydrogenase small subunit (CoxS/CutS family)
VIGFRVNGREVALDADPAMRLAHALRLELGLTGTKIGCDAGDCGACTVLIDGRQVCACLVPLAQVENACVTTVEGMAANGTLAPLQRAFARHGAAQCGICTPGMLMAATDLLARNPRPSEADAMDALGGVLCRCTGYRKIIDAVLDVGNDRPLEQPATGAAVGARVPRLDGAAKLTGREMFGADEAPADSLWLRAVRSPHAHARFTIGALDRVRAAWPGLVDVITAADVPGHNSFGIYPHLKDQPGLAERIVRHRGEAVAALVGDRETIERLPDDELPITWEKLPAHGGIDGALAPGAHAVHDARPDNVLISGRLVRGDVAAGFESAAVVSEGDWETSFVEHAYIEPEAGWARRVGDRLELAACTQSPYMDRDEVARILGIPPENVRILPTAIGGGFGGKLDLSLQPLIAVAAWKLGRPVRCIYHRIESMASTTKRHPARMTGRLGADRDGRFVAYDFRGDFNTGAYASWGPTVASRVPVHATGPYRVPNARAAARAIYTNDTPAGAFRGFGIPQAAITGEALIDDVAWRLGIDRLEIRRLNALRVGDTTACGQVLTASVGLVPCLDALEPHWRRLNDETAQFNKNANGRMRRGMGIACMWYGIGNTSMSNPSDMHVGIDAEGRLTLFNGAVDMGQGPNTIMAQICADALGLPLADMRQVHGDTDLTRDAGKSSASRQTFVSGKAAELAGRDLRAKILRLANAGDDARLALDGARIVVEDAGRRHVIELARLPARPDGLVLVGEGRFDPPAGPLDADGQGVPYATYGFGAQMAQVEVDVELGTVKPLRIVGANDVGRAINPTLVEGQVHGGVAQGLGLALMEEYIPGRTENLHDYLIPSIGDVPPIETILIEDTEPLGPYGAKGVGEPALIPTAPAILGAIRHATGAIIRRVPALPHRVLAAIREARR